MSWVMRGQWKVGERPFREWAEGGRYSENYETKPRSPLFSTKVFHKSQKWGGKPPPSPGWPGLPPSRGSGANLLRRRAGFA